jgi:NTE family protein
LRARNFNSCLFLLLFLSACATGARKSESTEPSEYEGVSIQEPVVEEQAIPESYGPELPGTESQNDSQESAAPQQEQPPVIEKKEPKLCLILGPGMARAIAHAAVLEAIKKAELPVHCVVGSEMGAVVGALYVFSHGSANNLQWQLFKFNKENYFNFPLLSLREPKSSGKKLNDTLREVFRDQRVEDLPIRFGVSATEPISGTIRFLDRGNLTDALSATLAMPGIFDPWRSSNGELLSGAVSSPAPIELARSLGGTFFVLIDVMEDSSGKMSGAERFQKAFSVVKNLIKLQKKEASFVVQVKAGALPLEDFSRQGEILAAGSEAAELNIESLKAAWEKAIAE